VVVVDGTLGLAHPLSTIPMPAAVQFLPAYVSCGPKLNGGMMSPHFVCLEIAEKKIGPSWLSCPW
jgi:hypothetical protein